MLIVRLQVADNGDIYSLTVCLQVVDNGDIYSLTFCLQVVDNGDIHPLTVCSADPSETVVYTSSTNQLQVYFTQPMAAQTDSAFVLKYSGKQSRPRQI